MTDDDSVAAQRRLAEALAIIASGTLDECPVCLEQPAPCDARVLRCCQAIMCRRCIPSCSDTCPFCRRPFVDERGRNAGQVESPQAEEGESPFSYTTKDYSVHREYECSVDYTLTRRYDSKDYAAPQSSYGTQSYHTHDYSSHAYAATNDYSSNSSKASSSNYTSSNYTSSNYTSSNYTSSIDYSSVADKYSVSGNKYTASEVDGSAIADKYKIT
jgi:hypothetical protein